MGWFGGGSAAPPSAWTTSRYKTVLRMAQGRVRLVRGKRTAEAQGAMREAMACVEGGEEARAAVKVELALSVGKVAGAMEVLELVLELLVVRLPLMDVSEDVPPDLREEVASVLWAAPRAPVPELMQLHDLLIARYGRRACLDLAYAPRDDGDVRVGPSEGLDAGGGFSLSAHAPSEWVHSRLVERLSVGTPSSDEVREALERAAAEHGVQYPTGRGGGGGGGGGGAGDTHSSSDTCPRGTSPGRSPWLGCQRSRRASRGPCLRRLRRRARPGRRPRMRRARKPPRRCCPRGEEEVGAAGPGEARRGRARRWSTSSAVSLRCARCDAGSEAGNDDALVHAEAI